jgi:choline dehydrogenase-like flavoprotein
MFIDGRSLETGTKLEADVCIVGAGAAGLATALDLAGGPLSVVILESGGDSTDKTAPEAAAAARAFARRFEGRARSPLLPRRNRYLEATRASGFGGLGATWRGSCRPLDTEDFVTRDWVPDSGWPFERAELEPWLERAAELLGIDPAAGAQPPPSLGRGFDASWLAYAPQPSIAQIFRPTFEFTDEVRVLTHAHATRLELGDDGRVASAIVRCLDGPRLEVRARTFVVAAGVIENARLLLASNGQRGRGLGNENDHVGRYFMEQIVMQAGQAVLTARPDVLVPYGEAGFHSGGAAARRAVLQLPQETQERHELLNALVMVEAAPAAVGGALAHDLAQLTATARDLGADAGPSSPVELATVTVRGEQTPRRGSRVGLGGKRDPFGEPTANVNWSVSWHDAWSLRSTARLFGESLGRAGDGRLRLDADSRVTRSRYRWSGHQSGTTRMSRQAASGVVDPDCRVHDIENLYVAGSSVFPTGGCSGPMLTVLALALRLGAHLRGLAGRPRRN